MARAQPKAQRSKTEKQALKEKTRNAERYAVKREGRRRDFANEIEFNNAATGGHADDPVPTTPHSRSAVADEKRAAAKGAGTMSVSTKTGMAPPAREADASSGGQGDGVRRRGNDGAAPVRRTKSNAEIAEAVTTTARKSPAWMKTPTGGGAATGAAGGEPARMDKRTGAARQRVPAPGNAVAVPKGELISGQPESKKSGIRSTSSTGGAKPPKRSARAGKSTGASRAKGADLGLE